MWDCECDHHIPGAVTRCNPSGTAAVHQLHSRYQTLAVFFVTARLEIGFLMLKVAGAGSWDIFIMSTSDSEPLGFWFSSDDAWLSSDRGRTVVQGREGGIEYHIGTGWSWWHGYMVIVIRVTRNIFVIDTTKYLHEKSCNVRVINLLAGFSWSGDSANDQWLRIRSLCR